MRLIILVLMIVGCTNPKSFVAVPDALVVSNALPIKPNPAHATQKDIAIYILQLKESVDICHVQLQTIKSWSDEIGRN